MSRYQYRAEPRALAAKQRRVIEQSINQSINQSKFREESKETINIMRDPRVIRGTNYGRNNQTINHDQTVDDHHLGDTMVDQSGLPATFNQSNRLSNSSSQTGKLSATIRQSIKQSFDQSMQQSRNQFTQALNQTINQSNNQTIKKPLFVRPSTPEPVEGRQHFCSQTDPLIEDLRAANHASNRTISQTTQTDADLDFDTPVIFEPQSSGTDVGTSINHPIDTSISQSIDESDEQSSNQTVPWLDESGNLLINQIDFGPGLADFDRDVESINQTITNRAINEALIEVSNERELAQLNESINQSISQSNKHTEKVAKLQAIEDKIAEEKKRRLSEEIKRLDEEAKQKAAYEQQLIEQQELIEQSIKQSIIEQSINHTEIIKQEIEQEFLPWLIEQVNQSISHSNNQHLSLNEFLQEALQNINQSINQSANQSDQSYFNAYVNARVNNLPIPRQSINQTISQTNSRRECFLATLNNQSVNQSKKQVARAEAEALNQISIIRSINEAKELYLKNITRIQALARARVSRQKVQKIKERNELLANRSEWLNDHLIDRLINSLNACLQITIRNYQPQVKQPVDQSSDEPDNQSEEIKDDQSNNQSIDPSTDQSISHSTSQSMDQSNNQFVITLSTASNASTRPSTTMLTPANQSVNSSINQSINQPAYGLLIERVRVLSTANQAGLLAGDIIVAINGEQLTNESANQTILDANRSSVKQSPVNPPSINQTIYQSIIASRKPGDIVILSLYRPSSDRIDEIKVELESDESKEYSIERIRELRGEGGMPIHKEALQSAESALAEIQKLPVKLGMTVVKRPKGLSGVQVSKLVAGGAAERAKLKDGDVIVKVGKSNISNVDDWKEASANWLAGEYVTLTMLDQSIDQSNNQSNNQSSDLKRMLEIGTTGKKNTIEWVRTLRSMAKLKYAKNPVD